MPISKITISSPYSKTVLFRPTSSIPPRGIILKADCCLVFLCLIGLCFNFSISLFYQKIVLIRRRFYQGGRVDWTISPRPAHGGDADRPPGGSPFEDIKKQKTGMWLLKKIS